MGRWLLESRVKGWTQPGWGKRLLVVCLGAASMNSAVWRNQVDRGGGVELGLRSKGFGGFSGAYSRTSEERP